MKRRLAAFMVLVFSVACSESESTTGNRIQGTVTLEVAHTDSPVRVGGVPNGALSLSFSGIPDFHGFPIVPMSNVSLPGPGTSRSYSYELPEDYTNFDAVVAWIDEDDNGQIDTLEAARFPVKTIDGTPYTIDSWGYFVIGNEVTYLIPYGLGNNVPIEDVGQSGFDFSF